MIRLIQQPPPSEKLLLYVGDFITFEVRDADGKVRPPGWEVRLRTNLGRASILRKEIINSVREQRPLDRSSWRDIPFVWNGDKWILKLPVNEVGYFEAKAYALDSKGWQYWTDGPNVGISVHPSFTRARNLIYCAFVRLFGPSIFYKQWRPRPEDMIIQEIEKLGYSIIPPSGTIKDLIKALPHIFERLGCRILHLLPIQPVPTVCARLGRMGSPYAALNLTLIDPALIEWNRRTTGLEQFEELSYQVHKRGGRLLLDVAINHTGWHSQIFEEHPEWFKRNPDGTFKSPGAWGIVWEDLVELNHENNPQLRELIAEALIQWCRRGVDGFRCDAGYMIPLRSWQYIIARVREEFPETIFLLEGLGGPWDTTELLLTHGNMQWAYSELFQNYTGTQISGYLDYALEKSKRIGIYVHYSETHDNPRLASGGKKWALARNWLCGLTSVNGAFGFTCGVEWLATEKIDVHNLSGLNWGSNDNIVEELLKLNKLLANHPCFFAHAELKRISPPDSPVYCLTRTAADQSACVLVIINTDIDRNHTISLRKEELRRLGLISPDGAFEITDLLENSHPLSWREISSEIIEVFVPAGQAYCLERAGKKWDGYGNYYLGIKQREACIIQTLTKKFNIEQLTNVPLLNLEKLLYDDPARFIGAVAEASEDLSGEALAQALLRTYQYPKWIEWEPSDASRITPCPCDHWLLIKDNEPFRVRFAIQSSDPPLWIESVPVATGYVAFIPPSLGSTFTEGEIVMYRYAKSEDFLKIHAKILYLPETSQSTFFNFRIDPNGVILLTNGRGGMSRLRINLGTVLSKYDATLAANLNPEFPTDRHVFVKRIRVWINADGFLSPLDINNIELFEPGPPPRWIFKVNAGDARIVRIIMEAYMLQGYNTVIIKFTRPKEDAPPGRLLPETVITSLTVRVDIEDRNFHWETYLNEQAKRYFLDNTIPLKERPGFQFKVGLERMLTVYSSHGFYHHQPEWLYQIPHPIEGSRGMTDKGDAFSPGWFEIPIRRGDSVIVVMSAEKKPISDELIQELISTSSYSSLSSWIEILKRNLDAYIAKRNKGYTVIAGYPWFLDWSRDTLIFVRCLIQVGRYALARDILLTLASYEKQGTLPNALYGEDDSNRESSDAPLWLGIACDELAARLENPERDLWSLPVKDGVRTLKEVLLSIANHYKTSTSNGVRMDPQTCLIFSPSHFTWMDTNYPACTPREGYPIEIQGLWIRFLSLVEKILPYQESLEWKRIRLQAADNLDKLFWLETYGWYGDVIECKSGESAFKGNIRTDLRPNALIPIALGILQGKRARQTVLAARKWLLVPGAIRSLAPLAVEPPLKIRNNQGQILFNPTFPYHGRYEGDEDTQRKPAYHNGTAWVWLLPVWCEALIRAWDYLPSAIKAAKAWLNSLQLLLWKGCIGHLPEILDGDQPHEQRGCDAQAWSMSEALRVWSIIDDLERNQD